MRAKFRTSVIVALLCPIASLAQDNSCQYAQDRECDELRFGGGGFCSAGTDTFDCAIVATGSADDSCEFARDNECDEPRYANSTGSCRDGTDATDCASALTPAETQAALFALLPDDLRRQLGNDECTYANDLECDDGAFGGTGSCPSGTDASDCRAVAIGGDNSCEYAKDNECDEPAIGTGYCASGRDTFDCAMIVAGISDDSCQYARDNECDEPRFVDTTGACRDGTDATDCASAQTPAQADRAALDALLVLLPDDLRRQLGSDVCVYANDLECDDTAFGGTGACADGTDASDCRLLATGGDDSCQWANDLECDEPGIGGDYCASGSDTTDCAPVAFLRNRSDECALAYNNECDEPGRGTGLCPANTDTADCLGRGRPAQAQAHFFGRDDRFLPDVTQMPWRAIGQLTLESGTCTGTLVAPRLVLTAAHCLTEDGTSVKLPETFFAGMNDTGYMDMAQVVSAEFSPNYNIDTAPAGEGNGNDWGLVTLDRDIGSSVGFLNIHVFDDAELYEIGTGGLIVDQAGYSWDTGDNLSGHRGCRITRAFDDGSILHECDTLQGDSGSPLLLRRGDAWVVIAVESQFFGAESKNSAFSQGNLAVDSRAFAKAAQRAMDN